MIINLKKILGTEKLHPDVQFFLDSANLNIARPGSFIVMLLEIGLFITTFFYTVKDGQDPVKWRLYHRTLYTLLFLASTQLFIYSTYHITKEKKFSRFFLGSSMLIFFLVLIFFGICISLNDYVQHEQIFVFLTIELFVTSLFMIKPYMAIILIVIPFGIFYYLMKVTIGISAATIVNYPIIMFFFIILNNVRYQHFLRIANHTVITHSLAEQLRDASRYDFLTKLKNRTALNMDFEDPENPNLNSNFIVMLTDIDDFKSYNDTNGHDFGDIVLKKFAFILQNTFGKKHCYRYGGDEYLVVIPATDEKTFLDNIKSCEQAINDEFFFSGGYSKGLVSTTKDLHRLISQADKKLYEAKGAGKNIVMGSFE